jgi:prephenate dehydrogenase
MLQLNPHVPAVLAAFGAAAADLRQRVEAGDPASFGEFFRRDAELFGPYLDRASAETDALIGFLAERG